MDPIIDCESHDEQGWWSLSVQRAGDGWELEVGNRWGSETMPFAGPDEVREFARTLLDLPTEPAPYQYDWEFEDPGDPSGWPFPGGATLHLATEPQADHRPYFVFQSWSNTRLGPALGLEVVCDNVPVEELRTQARALLSSLPT
ncbi:hypothetical protein [Streptomyces rubellomurinus]|uniref:DUF317 domain-containing protein n=1 Tax=Streptomyces rubellomurinus (strain ATCC 31215) TaxID=359131 RepID=A0A0F2TIG1_STRR3|nr:hypothetical protein [Streptomyces rubellomurinus]KJS62939.1 hypothetical protein VM95_05430 [Streptomyces rubellomurinus]